MNIIHMKKPGVYKRPARALEIGKPFRMRDPKTCEWDTFIPVIVPYNIGTCPQCAFHSNNTIMRCSVRWEHKPVKYGSVPIRIAGICAQNIKGFSFMGYNKDGLVVFKRADDLLEDL